MGEKVVVIIEGKKAAPSFATQITKLEEGKKRQERGRKSMYAYESDTGLNIISTPFLKWLHAWQKHENDEIALKYDSIPFAVGWQSQRAAIMKEWTL